MTSAGPLGIYIHVPFCRVRCSYCPFAITTSPSGHERYIDAVIRELATRLEGGVSVDTIYFGGGTPSRVAPALIGRVLRFIRERVFVEADAEVTLEANPEDVSTAAMSAWRELGVNRISLGVQSLHDSELRATGRAHTADEALIALERAVGAGFRVTADLMIGLPGQTLESFSDSLQRILDAGVGHLSTYMLDLEEGTPLHRQVAAGRTTVADDDQVADSYLHLVAEAERQGLAQYETSNFAREGERSRHNSRYWQGRPYLGVGVSAHSFEGSVRRGNVRSVDEYVERIEKGEDPTDLIERLDDETLRRERIFLGLRQIEGLAPEEFARLTGAAGEEWLERGLEAGWLKKEPRVAFTPRGFLLSTALIAELF